jgi:hypothetical protein
MRTVRDAIVCYEKATGAKQDFIKFSALAVGTWDTAGDLMGIRYCEEIMILGVKMRNTGKQTALTRWTRLASLVRTQARGAYIIVSNVAQRITFTQVYMLTKLWYTAQVLQPPSECQGQFISAIVWYICRAPFFECQYQHCRGGIRTAVGV